MSTLQSTLSALADVPTNGSRLAAKEVERIAREVGTAIGPVALGKRKRRVRLTAVTRRFQRSGNAVSFTVYGKPTGPWVWVTAGTGAHIIPKPRRSKGKARTTRYLKGDRYSHPIGVPVQHPGASGKGAWRRVVHAARAEVPKVYVAEVRKVVGR